MSTGPDRTEKPLTSDSICAGLIERGAALPPAYWHKLLRYAASKDAQYFIQAAIRTGNFYSVPSDDTQFSVHFCVSCQAEAVVRTVVESFDSITLQSMILQLDSKGRTALALARALENRNIEAMLEAVAKVPRPAVGLEPRHGQGKVETKKEKLGYDYDDERVDVYYGGQQ